MHNQPDFNRQIRIRNENNDFKLIQSYTTSVPSEEFRFTKINELWKSMRLWIVVSGVLLTVSVMFLSLLLYSALSGTYIEQETSL